MSFHVESDVYGFVTVGPHFPSGEQQVPVDAFFNDAVQVEDEGAGVAFFESRGKRAKRNGTDSGYDAAEHFDVSRSARDRYEGQDVADEGIECCLVRLFPNRFKRVGESCDFGVSDEGQGTVGTIDIHGIVLLPCAIVAVD